MKIRLPCERRLDRRSDFSAFPTLVSFNDWAAAVHAALNSGADPASLHCFELATYTHNGSLLIVSRTIAPTLLAKAGDNLCQSGVPSWHPLVPFWRGWVER